MGAKPGKLNPKPKGLHWGYIEVYRDNGKECGNYYYYFSLSSQHYGSGNATPNPRRNPIRKTWVAVKEFKLSCRNGYNRFPLIINDVPPPPPP